MSTMNREQELQASPLAHWRWTAVALIACLGIVLILLWDTAASAVMKWYTSGTFNHCFLILPISIYLVYERRSQLENMKPTPCYWGLAILIAVGFGWFLGQLTDVLVVRQLGLVLMIQAIILILVGWRIALAFAFPLAYLLFLVPFGEALIPYFQDFTAYFAVTALRIIGIPVFIDGIFLTIPTGVFKVAEACSGVRFLIATIALGLLFANMMYQSWVRRFIFIILSIVVPIVANWIRALSIVLVAYWSNNEVAVGVDHIVYGWFFFSIVMVLLMLIGMTFRDGVAHAAPAHAEIAEIGKSGSAQTLIIPAIATIGIVMAFLLYAAHINTREAPVLARLIAPSVNMPWTLSAAAEEKLHPNFPGADTNLISVYQKDSDDSGQTVDLFIAFYTHERDGSEVVSHSNNFESDKWSRAGSGYVNTIVDGHEMRVAYTRLAAHAQSLIVWHWYWVNGRYTSNPYVAKLLQIKAKIFDQNRSAAFVAVASAYDYDSDRATDILEDFLAHLEPIGAVLAGATE